MNNDHLPGSKHGLNFVLPEAVKDKKVSVIEVGPYNEAGLAKEINKFLNTNIKTLTRIDTYLLVLPLDLKISETLLNGKPFVDPIMHRATLNSPLAVKLGLSYDYVLQSMLNPGTSDAEGDTALRQTLIALGKPYTKGDTGFYSKQYFLKAGKNSLFSRNITETEIEEVSRFLANPDLNTRLVIPEKEYLSGKEITVPLVTLKPETKVETYDVVNMSDEELIKLNSTRKLAASLEEMKQFRNMYKDEEFLKKRKEAGLDEKATDVELEVWFGLRSEHCFHKEFNANITLEDKAGDPIFKKALEKGFLKKNEKEEYLLEKGIFKTFIQEPAENIFNKLEKRGKNWIASMFGDNSGVVYYNEDYMFCIKYETHNSPSNKEPIQGAKTGIDGVNRDIFGTMMGSFDAVANFFFFCTGNPNYKGWLPHGVKHPYTILKGITRGVREGGNESQIPTLNGGICTDPRYIAKCLVYCGTVGFSPVNSSEGKSLIGKNAKKDDLVFVAGQPVGIDGVHGATESSLSASADISLGHVQADFSFIQAKAKEFILDAARSSLFSSISDCGAMGISVTLEIARETGGLDLDLALHPKKYAGIQPWQIACSETQDRMVPVSPPENKEEIFNRARLHDVQITELGKLTDSGYVNLKYEGKTAALIDINKISNKEPRKYMHARWAGNDEKKEIMIKGNYSLEESLCLVISQPDAASKEWFFRQKDSSVKGGTIQGPLMGLEQKIEADAAIQKPLCTEGKDFGAIAYALGITPKLSDIDPYYAVQRSFIDMVGKIIALGASLPDMEHPKWDAWAVCGNYCQPNSDSNTTLIKESGEHNLASLVREGIGIRDVIEKLNLPVISGKDSMKCSCIYEVDDSFKLDDVPPDLKEHIVLFEDKDSKKRSIEIHDPDTYLASCAVRIKDHRKCVNPAFKQEGDLIYFAGRTKNHAGASVYLSATGYKERGAPYKGGEPPAADIDEFISLARSIHTAIEAELVASCKYIHNGGMITALAKSVMAGEKGAEIDVKSIPHDGTCSSDEELLYSETPGRFIITIAPKDKDEFEKIMGDLPCSMAGKVTNKDLYILKQNHKKEKIDLIKVKKYYQEPLSFGSLGS